jgi:hypothetical protein
MSDWAELGGGCWSYGTLVRTPSVVDGEGDGRRRGLPAPEYRRLSGRSKASPMPTCCSVLAFCPANGKPGAAARRLATGTRKTLLLLGH